jgi:hypothetical protein
VLPVPVLTAGAVVAVALSAATFCSVMSFLSRCVLDNR